MPTRQQLANPSTTQLAVMCGKVADDPAHYGELNAERAAEFKSHWVLLQTPPHPILRHQPKKEAQLSKLREEMAEFLAGIL